MTYRIVDYILNAVLPCLILGFLKRTVSRKMGTFGAEESRKELPTL